VVAGLLGALALALGVAGWASHARQQGESVTSGATVAARATVDPEGRAAVPPGRARPTHLRIPAIGVSAAITPLGIHTDRTVEVPGNPDEVGWYRLGSLPGQAGSAVILGHVDSTEGPAVFYRLRSVRRGDEVVVRAGDGSVTRFEVSSIATYANADFPARKVYRTVGRPGLALVTCGGQYDASRGGYQSNVVVFAVLAGSN
jgi:hypothetical protein